MSKQKLVKVPCNGCTACCRKFDAIFLHPEMGDDPSQYEHKTLQRNPLTGELQYILEHKPNGDCVYLGENGCTIHATKPAICAAFDCRRAYLKLQEHPDVRDAYMAHGYLCEEKMEAGRSRLHTLRRPR